MRFIAWLRGLTVKKSFEDDPRRIVHDPLPPSSRVPAELYIHVASSLRTDDFTCMLLCKEAQVKS